MKVGIDASAILAITAVVAVGAGAFWVYRNRELFNPADERNLANQGVNTVVQQVTGGAKAGGEDSLGGVLARAREWISGDDAKIRKMLGGSGNALVSPSSANVDGYRSYVGL